MKSNSSVNHAQVCAFLGREAQFIPNKVLGKITAVSLDLHSAPRCKIVPAGNKPFWCELTDVRVLSCEPVLNSADA
jgi:hypothetical protein